jgi:outer membrane protein W
MKKTLLAFALAAASIGVAQAQTAAPAAKPLRFLVGAGLTFGGDKLATAQYTNGGEINIHAGSMVALNAGIDYRINEAFSVQGTVGYHFDNASAENGSIRFERFPFELLGYYNVSPQWRVGGGVRYASNAKLSSSGVADFGDYEFDSTVSGVVEGEYMFGPKVGVKVRYVNEKFQAKIGGARIDGSHIGLLANYYF